jgi:hypothetical protein
VECYRTVYFLRYFLHVVWFKAIAAAAPLPPTLSFSSSSALTDQAAWPDPDQNFKSEIMNLIDSW